MKDVEAILGAIIVLAVIASVIIAGYLLITVPTRAKITQDTLMVLWVLKDVEPYAI